MDYVEQVEKFKKILVDTSEELMDTLGDKDTNMDKFDMKISVAGTILTVPMNADSFTRMLGFLDDEIKEEKEMQRLHRQQMVDALLIFRKGYIKVRDAWENYKLAEKLLEAPYYPFNKCFAELEVVEWCDDVLSELKKVR